MTSSSRCFGHAVEGISSLRPLPWVWAGSKRFMPRSKALCMRAMASPSVNLPHQPVETVHIPKPTSETFKFDLRRTRYFIKRDFTPLGFVLANWKRGYERWIDGGEFNVKARRRE